MASQALALGLVPLLPLPLLLHCQLLPPLLTAQLLLLCLLLLLR